ncbi:MAG: divergent PAP2 family protein [bacterium]
MIPILLIIPLITGVITQATKLIWRAAEGTFSWRSLTFYGGMPSAHTAFASSLITVVGLKEGVQSPSFALATIFGIIIVRDAIGFRRYIGSHSRALNIIVQDLPKKTQSRFRGFREQLGHTPLEAFVGAIIGIALSSVLYVAFM